MRAKLLFAFLLLSSVAAQAANSEQEQSSAARILLTHPSFYDPSGELFLQIDTLIYVLFVLQTQDSNEPTEINDLPIVSLGDATEIYDRLLQL